MSLIRQRTVSRPWPALSGRLRSTGERLRRRVDAALDRLDERWDDAVTTRWSGHCWFTLAAFVPGNSLRLRSRRGDSPWADPPAAESRRFGEMPPAPFTDECGEAEWDWVVR